MPVYEGNIDNIVGVLNVKGPAAHHPRGEAVDIRIMRPALLRARNQENQPPAAPVSAQQHTVIVERRFGGVSGIVTIEGVMEELVGETRTSTTTKYP
jgi:CBS domain containing-hemolysin-like protein